MDNRAVYSSVTPLLDQGREEWRRQDHGKIPHMPQTTCRIHDLYGGERKVEAVQ